MNNYRGMNIKEKTSKDDYTERKEQQIFNLAVQKTRTRSDRVLKRVN